MTIGQHFPKRERLVSRKLMDELFGDCHSMAAFPLRAVYIYKERAGAQSAVQLLISVPKKRFHHAVDRNRVKRQIRESFRRHQQILLDAVPEGGQLVLAFIWQSNRHCPSAEIERRLLSLMQRIAEKIIPKKGSER